MKKIFSLIKVRAFIKRIFRFKDYKIQNKIITIITTFLILLTITMIFSLNSLNNIEIANSNKLLLKDIERYASEIVGIETEYINSLSDFHLSRYTLTINNLSVSFNRLKKEYPDLKDIDFILYLLDDHMKSFFAIGDTINEKSKKNMPTSDLLKLMNQTKLNLSKSHEEFYSSLLKFNKK